MSSDLLHTLFSNLWSTFLVVAFFVGSIFVHELGHFLAARRRGVHVERFSIGIGPPIWSWRSKDGVEYCISWIPLGGYVLLPQLADLGALEGKSESDAAKLPAVSYSSKMLVFVAGATFNLLFAFLLATAIWIAGQPENSASATTRIGYVAKTVELPNKQSVPSPALEAGLQTGDLIRSIDGSPVENWSDVLYLISLGSGHAADGRRQAVFTIERNGQTMDFTVYPRLVGEERDRKVGIAGGYELIVQEVATGSVAEKAGFKVGDEILSLDGVRTLHMQTFVDQLSRPGLQSVVARVKRGGQEISVTIPARTEAGAGANIGLGLTTGFKLIHPSPIAQISENIGMTFRTLWSLLNPHSDVGLSKVSGPVGIVRVFHSAAEAGLRVAVIFAILVNVNLAIFNLLPLPILDGGQMLFATIGKLRGRALPANFIIAAQSAFGVLLITMVLYVSFFDVRRWARDVQESHAEAAAQPPPAAPATKP
jgi:regulator of sigma E protease